MNHLKSESIISDDNRVTNYANNRFTQLNNNEDLDDPLNFEDNLKIGSEKAKDQNLKTLEFKIIVIGEYNVGKTSIINRFVNNSFDKNIQNTINSNISTKRIIIDNKTIVNLNIWDTAGEEKLNPLIKNHYNDARGALIIYDIGNRNSFEKIEKWYNEIKDNCPHYCMKMLIGNKTDISDKKIDFDEGNKLAEKLNINFLEVSAKTGNNVAIAFERLCNIIIQRENEGDIEERKTLRISSKGEHKKKFKCCLMKD